MKKKTFIGLTVLALALSLVAGAAIRSSIGKTSLLTYAALRDIDSAGLSITRSVGC